MTELELVSTSLLASVNAFSDLIVSSIVGLIAVGTLSMALVQALKNLPIRAWYFSYEFRRFLYAKIAFYNHHKADTDPLISADVIEENITNTVAGGKDELYIQTLDLLMQSINKYKNVATQNPSFVDFKIFLLIFESTLTNNLISSAIGTQSFASIRASLNLYVEGSLEGFKASVQRKWRRIQQLAAAVISTCLIFLFCPLDNVMQLIVYGVVGGVIAPFAHDIKKAVKPG